jgi:hypothetical protein
MSAKETQQMDTKITTHYWGYREIDPSELNQVGGGYDGGAAGSSDTDMGEGWGGDNQEASTGCNLVGVGVLATAMCETLTADNGYGSGTTVANWDN